MAIYSIYFSPTNTTQKTVLRITDGIKKSLEETKIYEINLTFPWGREHELNLERDDVLILGLPVYGGRIPSFLDNNLNKIKGDNTLAIITAVYGNRDYDDALIEMKNILKSNGFITIAAGAFIGEHSYSTKIATNRPDAKDLMIIDDFSKKIVGKIVNIKNGFKAEEISVKGNYPYKERSPVLNIAPIPTGNCSKCGACASICPTQAISKLNPCDVDASKCIKCCACIKKCPESKRHFDNEFMTNITNMLEKNFTERKEPEIFI